MSLELSDLIMVSVPILEKVWLIFKTWWWLLLPFLFWKPFRILYFYFIQERWDATLKKIVLEIRMPKEVLKPIRAMEQVFAGFHAIHDVFTWREKWLEGQFQQSISLEIVSLGGEVHFYIRAAKIFRNIIESNIYSQYPEAEIFEVEDYTKQVPQDIPNKDWDLWGTSFVNTKPDPYPIKTYLKFESERETKEEKRIDPLAGFLEGMAGLRPGEQLWLQIRATPTRDETKPWVKQGLEIRDKLVRRLGKPKPKPMIQEVAEVLIAGKPPGAAPAEEKEIIPPEMKLTPGEREIVAAIEEKISKFGFDCHIRFIYLGKRDVFLKPMSRFAFGLFKEVSYEDIGGFKPDKTIMTKVKSVPFWFLDKRRVYIRKRRLFKNYQKRWSPWFPRSGGTSILNTEELATLFHFPGKIVAPAPAIPRVEVKKGEAPSGLPVE